MSVGAWTRHIPSPEAKYESSGVRRIAEVQPPVSNEALQPELVRILVYIGIVHASAR